MSLFFATPKDVLQVLNNSILINAAYIHSDLFLKHIELKKIISTITFSLSHTLQPSEIICYEQ